MDNFILADFINSNLQCLGGETETAEVKHYDDMEIYEVVSS